MSFILEFLIKVVSTITIGVCGLMLLKISPSPFNELADYIICSSKAFIFCYWQTCRSKWRGDIFLDYKSIFARSEPLTYKQLGNLLVSFGYNDSKYDEKYCYIMIFYGLNYFSKKVLEFYLAMPVLIEIRNDSSSIVKNITNPLGENLRVFFKRSTTEVIPNSDIRHALDNAINNDRFAGCEILKIFRYNYIISHFSSERDASSTFNELCGQICLYLGLIFRNQVPMQIENSPLCHSNDYQAILLHTDYTIFDRQHNTLCVVEITRSSLFTEEERNSMSIDYLCYDETHGDTNNKLSEVMKQLQTHMIVSGTRFGIIFDGYHLILVEYVNDLLYYESGCHRYFPRGQEELPRFYPRVRARILNVHSSCPSFFEGLTFFLYEAKQAKIGTTHDEIFDYFHEALIRSDVPLRPTTAGEGISAADGLRHLRRSHRFRRQPDRYSPTSLEFSPAWSLSGKGMSHKFLNWRTGAIILQRSSRNISTLCKIKAKYFKDVLREWVYDDEFAVIKIYDPQVFTKSDQWLKLAEYAEKCFLREKQAIHRLQNSKEYNNIYLRHNDVEVEYFHGYGSSMTGRTIISRFIESEPIPQTSEVYEQARRQLELIHEAGVIHGDISLRNMLFANGKLYIYDFRHSCLMSEVHPTTARVKVQEDYAELRGSFWEPPIPWGPNLFTITSDHS